MDVTDIENPIGPPETLRELLDYDPPADLWPRIAAKLPGKKLTRLLREREAEKARPKNIRGRRPVEQDYSQCDRDQLTKYIIRARAARTAALERNSENVAEVIERWDKQIRLLTKFRNRLAKKKRRNTKQRNAIIKFKKQEQLRFARELKKAENREAFIKKELADWLQTEPRYSSYARSIREMRHSYIYRWHGTHWVKAPVQLLKLAGIQENDVRREKWHMKDAAIYQNGVWREVTEHELRQLRPITTPEPAPVSAPPEPQKVGEPTFDLQNAPVDDYYFDERDNLISYTWQEQRQMRMEQYPAYRQFVEDWNRWNSTPVAPKPVAAPVVPAPVAPEEPRLVIMPSVDDSLVNHALTLPDPVPALKTLLNFVINDAVKERITNEIGKRGGI